VLLQTLQSFYRLPNARPMAGRHPPQASACLVAFLGDGEHPVGFNTNPDSGSGSGSRPIIRSLN